jgi:hypothetical protein
VCAARDLHAIVVPPARTQPCHQRSSGSNSSIRRAIAAWLRSYRESTSSTGHDPRGLSADRGTRSTQASQSCMTTRYAYRW